MIQVHSLAFGPFAEIEHLNPSFIAGHTKLRITVDTETHPSVPDPQVLERLTEAFPGLARHQCRVQETLPSAPVAGTKILLIQSDSSANQAHLLEHLALEMLSALGHSPRLSGVTCAYSSPPQRSDVFVECTEPESGGFAALLAVETMNAALSEKPLSPLYPDVVRCTRVLRSNPPALWSAARVAERAGIPRERALQALLLLTHNVLVVAEAFAMNLSGEPHYRFIGAGERNDEQG